MLEMIFRFVSRDSYVSYLSLSSNLGREIAMVAGFGYVSDDTVVVADTDIQDPPELTSRVVEL